MSDLITSALVRLDANLGGDKHDVIRALADIVVGAGRATDAGPADLAFLIAAPAGGDATHLQLLTKLARAWSRRSSPTGCGRPRPTRRSSLWSWAWWATSPPPPRSTRRRPPRSPLPAARGHWSR